MDQLYSREEYSKDEFWESQFKTKKGQFDWYVDFDQLKNYFDKVFFILKTSKILIVGCGNSKLTEQLYDNGYLNTVSIDNSPSVISQMNTQSEKKEKNISYLQMDALQMTFPDQTFDLVLDKGTLDALMCGNVLGGQLLKEMQRVTKKKGKLVIISHGDEKMRSKVFQNLQKNSKIRVGKSALNDASQMINIIRSTMKNRPLKDIFNEPKNLQFVLKEVKAFSRANRFRKMLTPKMAQFQKYQQNFVYEWVKKVVQKVLRVLMMLWRLISLSWGRKRAQEALEDQGYNPKRQSFCYIYEITQD